MRFQHLVDFFQNIGDPQLGGFIDRPFEIAPETGQQIAPIARTCTDLIQLVFQIRGEIIAHVFLEIIAEEYCDQAPLILGDQAPLIFQHIAAILDCGDDRGIGGRAANAQFFHALDQSGLGVAGGRLGEVALSKYCA